MNKFSHILILLLTACLSLAHANEIHDRIPCGKRVCITATPDSGYHFVQWSDGVTDNPRWIDLSEDINFEAQFEQDCTEPVVPVLRLYDWILMLNVDSLHQAGWMFQETDVNWYRIVDDTDTPTNIQDDQLLYNGYFLTIDQALNGTGDYYALIDMTAPDGILLCPGPVRSDIVHYSSHAPTPAREVTLHPNCVRTGAPMLLQGLPPEEETYIRVYDVAGREIRSLSSQGSSQFSLTAEEVSGTYLVKVSQGEQTWIFRYVATR